MHFVHTSKLGRRSHKAGCPSHYNEAALEHVHSGIMREVRVRAIANEAVGSTSAHLIGTKEKFEVVVSH